MKLRIVPAEPIVLVMFVVFVSGCAVSRTGGSSLSDVAKEASKDPKKEETHAVRAGEPTPEPEEDVYVEDFDTEAEITPSGSGSELAQGFSEGVDELGLTPVPVSTGSDGPSMLGVNVGWSGYDRDQFLASRSVSVHMNGYESGDKRLLLGGALRVSDLTFSDVVQRSFRSPWEMALDITARYYATPRHTFTGAYLAGGFRFGLLNFDFQNPVQLDDGETVEGESIWSYTPYVGLGLSVIQTRFVHLGGAITGGVTVFHQQTLWKGFENDFLDPSFYYQIELDLSAPLGASASGS